MRSGEGREGSSVGPALACISRQPLHSFPASRVVSSPILHSAAARSLRLQCNPVPASTFITVAPSASIVSHSPIPITPILRPRRRRALAE